MTAQPDPLPLPTEPVRERLAVRVTCRRCHRQLHDPESVRLGPECRGAAERTEQHHVDQETLPGL